MIGRQADVVDEAPEEEEHLILKHGRAIGRLAEQEPTDFAQMYRHALMLARPRGTAEALTGVWTSGAIEP